MRLARWSRAALKAGWHRTGAVNLIVTRRCDLSCAYCHAVRKTPELEVTDWLMIASKLAERFSVFTVSGGEPMLYRPLPQLLTGLHQLGLVGLCTNLRVFREEHEPLLQVVDYLNFSIDTDTEGGVPGLSKKDGFGKIEWLSNVAKRHGVSLAGTVVVTRRNVDRVPEVVHALSREGVYANVQLVQSPGPDDCFEQVKDWQVLETLSERLLEMKRSGYLIDESDEYLHGFSAFAQGKAAVRCRAGEAFLAIDADGCLMPCQATQAIDQKLSQTTNLEHALNHLCSVRPDGCRCWWNCYHWYADWANNPVRHLLQRGLALAMPPRGRGNV